MSKRRLEKDQTVPQKKIEKLRNQTYENKKNVDKLIINVIAINNLLNKKGIYMEEEFKEELERVSKEAR